MKNILIELPVKAVKVVVPAKWDTMTEKERIAYLKRHAVEATHSEIVRGIILE